MITNRELAEGTILTAKYKGRTYQLVVEFVDGKPQYRHQTIDSVTYYPSLSAAGSDLTGTSVNGWRFWSVAGDTQGARYAPPEPVVVNVTPSPEFEESLKAAAEKALALREQIRQQVAEEPVVVNVVEAPISFGDIPTPPSYEEFPGYTVEYPHGKPDVLLPGQVLEATITISDEEPAPSYIEDPMTGERYAQPDQDELAAIAQYDEQAEVHGDVQEPLTRHRQRTTPLIRKSRDQKNLGPAEARYFCAACGDHFVKDLEAPLVCPAGHTARG